MTCRFEQIAADPVPAHDRRPSPAAVDGSASVRTTCLCRLAQPPGAPCALVLTTAYDELIGSTLALLSSRTGRIHRIDHPWLARMRAALAAAEQSRSTLLAVQGTTVSRWLCAVRELLACPVHRVELRYLPRQWDPDPRNLLRPFLCQLARSGASTIVLLPRNPQMFEPPADYVAAVLARRLCVVYTRPGGNVDRLLRLPAVAKRASYPHCPPHPLGSSDPPAEPQPPHQAGPKSEPVASLPWHDFLFHWTRAQSHGWPGEPPNAPLAKLLLATESYDAFSALKRIAYRGVIYASGTVEPFVSLTATAPTEWRDRRVYRHHRGRFDYELYGIAIHKAEVLAQGGVPVCYCDPPVYAQLPRDLRTRFQPLWCPRNPRLRWNAEHEWRVFGDLVLSVAPARSVFFLAPSPEEAREITRISGRPCAFFGQS